MPALVASAMSSPGELSHLPRTRSDTRDWLTPSIWLLGCVRFFASMIAQVGHQIGAHLNIAASSW